MSVIRARLPISGVNIEVAMPSVSTTAKPRTATGAEHPQHEAGDQRRDVRVGDRRERLVEAGRMAACGETPLRSSSRMRS